MYLQPPPHEQDVSEGQFLYSLKGLNSEFSFS